MDHLRRPRPRTIALQRTLKTALNTENAPLNANVELKVRLPDLDRARQAAEQICTARLGTQQQVDTYFRVCRGRLKLRQIDSRGAELIWYERPDTEGPKTSHYRITPVAHPETLKQTLAAALGIDVVVAKRREIFLFHTVRIHLDQVERLGTFLEFEAVVGPAADERRSNQLLAELSQQFGLSSRDLQPGSYCDLLRDLEA